MLLRENCQSSSPRCVLGTNTCLGMNHPHPAAPNTKPRDPHNLLPCGINCKYSSCLHEGRAANPKKLKSLRSTHRAGTSELSCDISGKSSAWVHAHCACSLRASPTKSPSHAIISTLETSDFQFSSSCFHQMLTQHKL